MNNNIKVDEKTIEKTKEIVDNDTQITPPENYDVMLYNDNTVSFEAVKNVLATVLNLNTITVWALVMKAHTHGKASVYTGPEDVAHQYKDALLAEAQARNAGADGNFNGYGRMRFEVEKVKK